MKPKRYVRVDPATLVLPTTRVIGADLIKLMRQFSKYGIGLTGMPPPEVWLCKDGLLQICDGTTRATRVAKYLPGVLITVQITEEYPRRDVSTLPRIGDRIP